MRKLSPLKIFIFILLLVFYGSFLLHKIDLPAADDLPRHIKNGELILNGQFEVLHKNLYSYTEPDHSFVNHHWLSGVIFYLLFKFTGWGGLVIFKVLVFLIAFIFLFFTSLKKSSFWLVALFSLPTILILTERTTVRPEMFSYLFIAIYLYLLISFEENPKNNKIFWLIPLQILWVNLHIFFPIGFMLVGGFLAEKIILNLREFKTNPVIKKLFIILLIVTAVSCINPNGINGFMIPVKAFGDYGASISENQSLNNFLKTVPPFEDISASVFKPVIFILAISFFFGFRLRRKPIFYLLASIATSVAGFLMIRTTPFLGLIFLPAISTNFSSFFRIVKDWMFRKVPHKTLILKQSLIFIFVIILIVINAASINGKLSLSKKGIGITPRSMEAAHFFVQNHLKGPILNDFGSGSYLIQALFPKEQVFVDNRTEAYSSSFFRSIYFPVTETKDGWLTLSQKYNFNTIFMYQYSKAPKIRSFLQERLRDPTWALVYAGTYHFIFLRNTPENQSTIKNFHITSENVEEKLSFLVNSTYYDDQIAAADIFNLIGREDLGAEMNLKVVERWPKSRRVWMMMGAWELLGAKQPKNYSLAVSYLEKAISLGQETAEAYYYLSIGYKEMGQLEKAKEAVKHSLKINPEYTILE